MGAAPSGHSAPGSEPTAADAHACVARLRELYPSHPVIGYIPQWYWGNQSTRFVDVLWASDYVTGTGPPAALYAKVTPQGSGVFRECPFLS